MITSRVQVEARFKRVAKDEDGTERTWFHVEPVVAFDDAGEPLAVDPKELMLAKHYQNFERIDRSKGRVVATLPAGDWRIRQDNGVERPIIGWVVYEDGT